MDQTQGGDESLRYCEVAESDNIGGAELLREIPQISDEESMQIY